ncbi:MAG: sodium/proton antiporter NhaB [Gammaproteobacteria bacterium]|nr:sodium/proton antiporter NhaB [Gammaproteobacteria bacterium]MDP2142263.1 sodium/proton antiporter NhaB [Gammaproteobacteria bacterium]MDP2347585.1 sodium/proton antiporter NhaB [Gammaproteobacteria bacterium]
MTSTYGQAFLKSFLGQSPDWYKLTIVGFLILNPLLFFLIDPFVAGWVLILEFIFTLAMALKCYPLQAGGLLAFEAIAIGMASPETVYAEALTNFPVILLLIFMVAGISFLKEMLLFTFTKILLRVRSKLWLSLLFAFVSAVLSAFLDALTVTAVVIAVASGFFAVYHRVASGLHHDQSHDVTDDGTVKEHSRADLEQFRAFLRNIMMHAAIGTALGGVSTIVGEPQNLLIGSIMGWDFIEFYLRVAPVSIPVLIVGLITTALVEKFKISGYGVTLPENVRSILEKFDAEQSAKMTKSDILQIWVQAAVAMFLVVCLALHLAEVGIIGLAVIVLATAFNGITDEHRLGHAFQEAMPFTALLVVFFAVVGVIHELHLFTPVIDYVLAIENSSTQLSAFYIANGVLSMVSDNVFVATVYISEVAQAFEAGRISREQFELLAVAINTGTNVPSVATPNGQAAFLFLLTSALAPLIRLSYGRMVVLALPYTFTLSITGLLATMYLL